jgi:pilus assembly protein CpaB
MKEKKLLVLYILMLFVGLALLFTKSSPEPAAELPVQQQVVVEEPKKEEPQKQTITIAVAKHDINKNTILTKADYYFKSIEVEAGSNEASKYISDAMAIDAYVSINNIAKDTVIESQFLASPNSEQYRLLALKDGNYMFPFKIDEIDSYLVKNLKAGDLVDLYVFYADNELANANNKGYGNDRLVSPSDNFTKNRIKPIIVGKKIIYIDLNEGIESSFQNRKESAQIQLELSNQEIKLLRTLMANSTVIMYPSTYKRGIDDGLRLLNDKEKNWPLTDKAIFSKKKKPLNLLKGN